MAGPHVRDFAAIVDALRHDGAVYWPLSDLAADFTAWRRDVRRAARAVDLRISVRRGDHFFWIEHVDHEPTDDQRFALADVMDAVLRGMRLSFEDALKRQARQRLRLVRGDADAGHQDDE